MIAPPPGLNRGKEKEKKREGRKVREKKLRIVTLPSSSSSWLVIFHSNIRYFTIISDISQ
jgi:hypothetical protein